MQARWVRAVSWRGPVLASWRRPCCLQQRPFEIRSRSTASALASIPDDPPFDPPPDVLLRDLTALPSPPPERALQSSKLAALHARLSLPRKLPLQTLGRALVDASADPHPDFNNASLAQLGNNLMGYYATEHIICHYPRLPTTVLHAAIYAYVGPRALTALVSEWGVEEAAEPGGEVDPGLLQLKHAPPEESQDPGSSTAVRYRKRSIISSRTLPDQRSGNSAHASADAHEAASQTSGITLDHARTNFARAVVGAVYLHCGRKAAKTFFTSHILSRYLSFSSLFDFKQPTRDLSRLCAREGFEGPVARLISETGRHSRHPVFVVGVYSGDDKLGEGAGSSLNEARTRAAVAALKSWYLYSPLEVRLPSETEEGDEMAKRWKPGLIDGGEVIV